MSGGIAYVLDVHRRFDRKCNLQMVELEQMDDEDESLVKELVRLHLHYTGSTVAELVLNRWEQSVGSFRKVIPKDLKRVLEAQKREVREVAHG
jgi:glutamate synthase domain-containing protein 3